MRSTLSVVAQAACLISAFAACGSPPPAVQPPAQRAAPPADSAQSAFVPYEPPKCDRKKFPEDAWSVCLFDGTETEHFRLAENWKALDFNWGSGGPDGLTDNFSILAQRRVCSSGDTFFFESQSDDGIQVSVGDEMVIDAWSVHQPQGDLSRGIKIDGCKDIRVRYFEKGGGAVFRLFLGVERKDITCDPDLSPQGAWNVCLFAGQRQEHLLGVERWTTLKATWPVEGGPLGRADNFSLEGRTTACFSPGEYIFHTFSDDGLRVLLDEQPLVDVYTDHGPLARNSARMRLDGCHKLRAQYYENNGHSVLDVGWALSNTAAAEQWIAEEHCGGACGSGAVCRDAGPFGGPKGVMACVGTTRASTGGEMCSSRGCSAGFKCERHPNAVPTCVNSGAPRPMMGRPTPEIDLY